MRRLARFVSVAAVSVVLIVPALATRVLDALGARRLALRAAVRVQRLWAGALLRVLGIEVHREGNPSAGPALVVANHLSYLDILVLGVHFPGRFVAKSEIAGWPGLGHLARSVGTIFVTQRRDRDVVRVDREMERTLAAGVSVLLFPEGRSSGGRTVARFHSSLFDSAARGRIPCLAVAMHYETPLDPWTPAATVCWWGGMGFWRHAWTLVGLRRIVSHVRVAPRAHVDEDRKRLADATRASLLEQFVPLRQVPVPPDYPWPALFAAPAGRGSDVERGSGA
jgi:1-acyl-sn-glycerol-3-phosphate acyltransferase